MNLLRRQISWPELGRALCVLGLALAVLLYRIKALHPADNTLSRLGILAILAPLLLGLLILVWPRKRVRWITLFLYALAGAIVCFPLGPSPNTQRLRGHFVRQLEQNLGKPFIWGAENGRAVDCSGLIRYSMRGALQAEFFATVNPRILHLWAKAWWVDRSARDFCSPWIGLADPVEKAASTPALNPAKLIPGDVAVTGYGSHILAYLGDHRWIQADPERGRVVVDTSPSSMGWYKFPVEALRLRWE